MKLLVTGGAGFIGSHLVERLLAEGHAITVLDDFNDFYEPRLKRANIANVLKDITLVEADLRDAVAVEALIANGGFEGIVHLAARAGIRPSIQNARLYIETNITGTFNLLDAARLHRVPRFILASSSSVYGTIKETPFREDMCIDQTISPYAATKLACEQLCSNFARLYGMRCTCLRFFTVYGPRQRPDLAIHKFARSIYEGRPIDQYGDGTTRRDYTYIDDILEGIMACLTYDGPVFDIFNLGESQTTSLAELIALIETTLGRKAQIRRLPEQPGDVPLTYADISKAGKLLHYQPSTEIAVGIPKFIDWFLQAELCPH
jgi:UDP-glucuronate 4-epimerase